MQMEIQSQCCWMLNSVLFLFFLSNFSHISSSDSYKTQTKRGSPIELFQGTLVRSKAKPRPVVLSSAGPSSSHHHQYQHEDPNSTTTAQFYSRIRSSGCKCGRKPFVDSLYPVFSFHYKRWSAGHSYMDTATHDDDEDADADLVRPLIVGGVPAEIYEFPWMTAIADISIPRQRIACGGVLINSHFVLTAAHCVQHKFIVWTEIWFNAHDIEKVKTDELVLRRKVKRFIVHPQYPQWNREHDIALIELSEPIDFTRTSIRPICLPKSSLYDFSGENGTVAGWGYNSSYSGVRTSTLHKVAVPILSHSDCTKTQHFQNVLPTMLCAGDLAGGKDACFSDSGGPLIVEHGRRNVVVGIVAWGRGCGRPNLPGVYTRVSSYLKWIETVARKGEWCHRINNKYLQRLEQ